MLKHNIKLFFRSIKRNVSSFLINIIGLSTGLACAMFIALWVSDELGVDKFHENHDRIYQVAENVEFSDGIQTMVESSAPMAEFLVAQMPEVEYASAVILPGWFGKHTLSVGDNTLKAQGQLVSKDYFNIFSYELIQGDKNKIIADPNAIVISKDLAIKLFGTTNNVVGKSIQYEKDRQFQVSGIFKGAPSNSTVQFDFALSDKAYTDEAPWNSINTDTWNSTGPQVYVLLKEGADIEALNSKVAKIRKERNENDLRTSVLIPFSEHYLHGTYKNGKQVGGRIEYVELFSMIAILILIIACINFMNLSTARASKRLKEIGVKKAVGAKRKTFLFQFLGESVLMSIMSLFVALFMVALLLPRFNTIVGKQLALSFDFNLVVLTLGITIVTGLLAGSYPAIYLSGFNAVAVLKGKLNRSVGELWTRKGLVVVQFALSIILIVSVIVVYNQIQFAQNQNLGYSKDNIVYFKAEGKIKEQLPTFLAELKKLPGIKNASGTTHSMIGHNWSTSLEWEGMDPENEIGFQIVGVDYDFIETMDMQIVAGRGFNRAYGDSVGVIFNETAIKAMGLEDPIGKIVEQRIEIVGVVKDFHFKSLHDKVEPLFMAIMPQINKVMVRIEAGKERDAIEEINGLYQAFNPGFQFEYEFLDDNYKALYASEQRVATLSKYFAGMAILISCLGLFGLAMFTAERRKKEISVRKVLGQTVAEVTVMLSSDFAKLVLVAILIALPIAYLVANNWLSGFAYHIPLKVWYFLAAGATALLVAMLTVGSQAIQAANRNPVDGLREE
ncbi:ABC transporter permease [Flagellimonas sp. S3867]|uniref:ABC transporter permease n=1 Tax=Flagellimonas sp. S3867 TaxID=2768063 RepID=UPI001689BC89|nr:ABC transporter permease [Flagellimonas sp. S3867]